MRNPAWEFEHETNLARIRFVSARRFHARGANAVPDADESETGGRSGGKNLGAYGFVPLQHVRSESRSGHRRAEPKRLLAEPLLDAVDASTLVQTKFKSLPLGTRAIELPDAEYPNYFLNTFGKPKRASVCECERVPDENLAQALHTLNGDILTGKIAHKNGRVAKLLAAKKSHEEIIQELYLATLSRYPSEKEKSACRQFLAESPSPKECYEDLHWALMNSKHFLFVR